MHMPIAIHDTGCKAHSADKNKGRQIPDLYVFVCSDSVELRYKYPYYANQKY